MADGALCCGGSRRSLSLRVAWQRRWFGVARVRPRRACPDATSRRDERARGGEAAGVLLARRHRRHHRLERLLALSRPPRRVSSSVCVANAAAGVVVCVRRRHRRHRRLYRLLALSQRYVRKRESDGLLGIKARHALFLLRARSVSYVAACAGPPALKQKDVRVLPGSSCATSTTRPSYAGSRTGSSSPSASRFVFLLPCSLSLLSRSRRVVSGCLTFFSSSLSYLARNGRGVTHRTTRDGRNLRRVVCGR